jgi:quaternary ammonium compound-resistance protein SugE
VNPWLVLVTASAFEVVMALGLKWSNGFTRLGGSAMAIGGGLVSMGLLAIALRSVPVGTGYAVWTGLGAAFTALGAAFTALVGMTALDESRDAVRVVGIAAVVTGVVLLQLSEHH